MKKGLVSKLGATALVLSLVTASLVGGTFAKYTKEVTGSATATIAEFTFSDNNTLGTSTVPVDLTKTAGELMPGSKGVYQIKLIGGTDIDVDYSVKIGLEAGSEIPTGLQFFSTADGSGTALAITTTPVELGADKISAAETPTEKIVYLSWEWPYDGDHTYDPAKTEIGFVLTATGIQADPNAPTTP